MQLMIATFDFPEEAQPGDENEVPEFVIDYIRYSEVGEQLKFFVGRGASARRGSDELAGGPGEGEFLVVQVEGPTCGMQQPGETARLVADVLAGPQSAEAVAAQAEFADEFPQRGLVEGARDDGAQEATDLAVISSQSR